MVVGSISTDGPSLLVYPTDRAAYSRLPAAHHRQGPGREGQRRLFWSDLEEWGEGLIVVLLTDEPDEALIADLRRLKGTFGNSAYCSL